MQIEKLNDHAYGTEGLKVAANPSMASKWGRLAMALILLLPALSAYGQFESATVLGYVKDVSGAAIPNGKCPWRTRLPEL